MKKHHFICTIAVLLAMVANVQAQEERNKSLINSYLHGWEYNIKAGFNIGGTSPIPLPKEIRKIDSYAPGSRLLFCQRTLHPGCRKENQSGGIGRGRKRPDRLPPATRTFHRRKPLCTLFRKRQITLQQMGTCQDQLRDAAERHSVQYPLGSAGRYRRTRISLHPPFSPEKQKESNPW